jgi:hypothetical protein
MDNPKNVRAHLQKQHFVAFVGLKDKKRDAGGKKTNRLNE